MKRKIKIAMVSGKMVGGGLEAIVMTYLRHLDKDRFDLTLLVDEDSTVVPEQEISDLGVRLLIIPPYQRVLAYHKALFRLFKAEAFDIVHAHINTLNVFPLFAAARAGVPVRIAHNHSTAGKGETKRNMAKYLLRPFAKLFPTTLCACGVYAGRWIYGTRTPFYVMPNNMDFEAYRYRFSKEAREAAREELGLTGHLAVGHAGRFIPQKNHKFLVDIFASLVKKRPDSRLLLTGSGKLEGVVREQVRSLGLEDKVIFAGQREDMPRLYQAMDIVLLPSLFEGLGLVPIEAQMSGLPVLCADTVPGEVVYDETLVSFLPLSASAETQADKALEIVAGAKSRETSNASRLRYSSGLERYVSAEELSDWYEALAERKIRQMLGLSGREILRRYHAAEDRIDVDPDTWGHIRRIPCDEGAIPPEAKERILTTFTQEKAAGKLLGILREIKE